MIGAVGRACAPYRAGHGFRDVLDLVAQLCPGVTPAEPSTQAPGGIPVPEDK